MSWIGAAIAAGSKLLSSAGDQYSSSKAYRRSVNSAQHAHQWEVGDLRAAGLNPILSATGGSGASAQAFQAAPMDLDPTAGLSRGAQAAVAKEQEKNLEADTHKKIAETNFTNWSSAEAIQRINKIQEETENLRNTRGLIQAQSAGILANALDAYVRSGTHGSAIQANYASAEASRATAYQHRRLGMLSQKEYEYWVKHPDEYTAMMNRVPGKYLAIPLALKHAGALGSSAKSETPLWGLHTGD